MFIKPITVEQLIMQLQQLNPKLLVIYTNNGCGMADGETAVISVSEKETEDWFSPNANGQMIAAAHLNTN